MKEDDIIYTDGHGVRITRDKFYTAHQAYNLDGITGIDLQRIPASHAPGIVFFVLGFLAILVGSLEMIGSLSYTSAEAIYLINGDMMAIGAGVLFIIAGIAWMVVAKDKYAVEIRTAEGEKKPVISKSREYAAIIATSLKKAYFRYVSTGYTYAAREKRREKVVIT